MHTALHAGSGHGGEIAPSDLLALQAGVYRYSEVVDLTSKLIDRQDIDRHQDRHQWVNGQ